MTASSLISTKWLAEHRNDPKLIILDASLPKPKAKQEDNPLNGLRIPGARFFDIDHHFSDTDSSLPHTMLSEDQFNVEAQLLGINNDSVLVIYDNLGIYASPRAWWMFRSMGHKEVYLLNGGLPQWVTDGYPTEQSVQQTFSKGNFKGTSEPSYFRASEEVLKAINSNETKILDARSSGRFHGIEPEPRAGLRGGHIPNSISLPFPDVLDGATMKSSDELTALFQSMGTEGKELIFSCGSGLTACIITLAAHEAGHKNLSVYDGSWSEWGQENGLPVAK
jgi:thiosulfate/3-mercaptopyruvate sulfurtransferase